MHLTPALALSGVLASTASALNLPTFNQQAIDSGAALATLNKLASANAYKNSKGSCKANKVKVRQEWRTLPPAQRRQFIKAVQCLQKSPSVFPDIEGAVTGYDDFTWIHLINTVNIHYSGLFLSWHRLFIHQYEKKLEACGWKGGLPYWEWGMDTQDVTKSPIFDGSDTSLGGNGEYIPHEGLTMPIWPDRGTTDLPPANGSGCVTKGPFGGMQTHLGPVALPDYGAPTYSSAANPAAKNTRCLKRDLNTALLRTENTFRNSTNLILSSPDIEIFRAAIEGDLRYNNDTRYAPFKDVKSVHFGGHFTIGGDPGSDAFISCGDPAFWLHHSQIDRMWWIWQNLDFANRQDVFGTHTILNQPASENVTVDEFLDIHPDFPSTQIKKLMNTVGDEPLCYVYA
ncbi:hypothetical protein QBC32DRAFT_101182 [Pseudoneurospora amorphoporcata]|uniref:Tyrosinase copper-binding domain-containing protein n=1 Tax=Pseudoneurospora amorphoporcata TaxID=241081 RepID=A0AAN6NZV8_9PEZI|nr:hypothetical protein QBC32DRAFT_101182 [Pseudoneurospora amorphoporcata]